MPTGYTAGIIDGTIKDFPTFAKQCMRAFGATIHMRDDDGDAEYKPMKESEHYEKEIAKSKHDLDKIFSISDDDLIEEERNNLERRKSEYLEYIAKAKRISETLNKMLTEVHNWQPPTEEHQGIKKFMIEQINSTINHDGDASYYHAYIAQTDEELKNLTADNIRQERITSANESLKMYTENRDNEKKRVAEANKWVTDLLDSLK